MEATIWAEREDGQLVLPRDRERVYWRVGSELGQFEPRTDQALETINRRIVS